MMLPIPSLRCFPLTGYCHFTCCCGRHCRNPSTDRSQHADAAGHCPEPRSLIGSGHLTGPATALALTTTGTADLHGRTNSARYCTTAPQEPVLPDRTFFTTRPWVTAPGPAAAGCAAGCRR